MSPNRIPETPEPDPNMGSVRYDQFIADTKGAKVPRSFIDKVLSVAFTLAGITFLGATAPAWVPIWAIRKALSQVADESKADKKMQISWAITY